MLKVLYTNFDLHSHLPVSVLMLFPLADGEWGTISDAVMGGDRESYTMQTNSLPLLGPHILEKLKTTITEVHHVDSECKIRAQQRFQYAFYGKLFDKTLDFEYVKTTLLGLWSFVDFVQILDMPNGFFLIHCASHNVMQKVLFGGQWMVEALPCKRSYGIHALSRPFTKLCIATIWIQLHTLLVDFWDAETLKTITESLGKLLKVDKHTASLSRTRFVRSCLEINLTKPLA